MLTRVFALSSLGVFVILIMGIVRREGWRKLLLYAVCITGYGITRAWVVYRISEINGVFPPYWIKHPLLSIGPASIQELVGWFIVVYLALYWGRFVLKRVSIQPTPFRLTLFGILFLSASAYLVESAAVAGQVWQWSLRPTGGLLGDVPFIGMIDWALVATDFILPYTVWSSFLSKGYEHKYAGKERMLLSLSIFSFPIHMLAHWYPDVETFSLVGRRWFISAFDMTHAVLVALVVALAFSWRDSNPYPDTEDKKSGISPAPVVATLTIVLVCGGILLIRQSAWTAFSRGLPLVFLLLPGFLMRKRSSGGLMTRHLPFRRYGWVVGSVICLTVFILRQPYHERNDRFIHILQSGFQALNEGDIERAENMFRQAVELRPGHSGGYFALAILYWQSGLWDRAMEWVNRVLEIAPLDGRARLMRILYEIKSESVSGDQKDLAFLENFRKYDMVVKYIRLWLTYRSHQLSDGDFQHRISRLRKQLVNSRHLYWACQAAIIFGDRSMLESCFSR